MVDQRPNLLAERSNVLRRNSTAYAPQVITHNYVTTTPPHQAVIETQEEQDMLNIKVELDVNFLTGAHHACFNR
jgi:hypothetical protein